MVFTSYSEVFTYCKLILFDEDLLECVDAVLLIENQHGFLVVIGIDRAETQSAIAIGCQDSIRRDTRCTLVAI